MLAPPGVQKMTHFQGEIYQKIKDVGNVLLFYCCIRNPGGVEGGDSQFGVMKCKDNWI